MQTRAHYNPYIDTRTRTRATVNVASPWHEETGSEVRRSHVAAACWMPVPAVTMTGLLVMVVWPGVGVDRGVLP